MEKIRRGRPKSKGPIKDKRISVKVTEDTLNKCREVCLMNDITYVDIIEKGLEYWSRK
ncbi:hypothetical protein [Anaerostipes hadrus]|uniref:hypothetical protein n=1 Tax=Anaerostipes hadrus TaxID=649756 RepID=UPI003567ABBE